MKQLDLAYKLQRQYPGLALGGSIGLFLHGIQLRSNYADSDLDFTADSGEEFSDLERCDGVKKTESADMDISYESEGIKIQIQMDPTNKWVELLHGDRMFKVSTVPHIISWKIKYSKEGHEKHIDDMEQFNKMLNSRLQLLPLDEVFKTEPGW